jgi:hypothetical protein
MITSKAIEIDDRADRGRGARQAASVLVVLLFAGLVSGCFVNSFYGYRAVFPSSYKVFLDGGKRERYIGQHAVGPRNSTDSYSAGISVTVAPEAVEGGEFDEPADQVKYLLACMRVYAANFVLAKNDVIQLDSVLASRLEFSYDIPNGMAFITRVREETIIAKRGTNLFTIVFSADDSEWASRQPEYEAFLKSFRWAR